MQICAYICLVQPSPDHSANAKRIPVALTAAQHRALTAEQSDYAENDVIFNQGSLLNPQTKIIAQTGNFQNAYMLLERLRSRFCKNY